MSANRARNMGSQSQPIALTLRSIDLFPTVHHVECVALREKTGFDLR